MRKRLLELRGELKRLPKDDPEYEELMPASQLRRCLDELLEGDKATTEKK